MCRNNSRCRCIRLVCPHARHRALAQRTAGLESGYLALSGRPVWGICAALPQSPCVRAVCRGHDLRCNRIRPVCPSHRRFSQQKCCIMYESPVRRAAPQHPEVDVNGSNGPRPIGHVFLNVQKPSRRHAVKWAHRRHSLAVHLSTASHRRMSSSRVKPLK